MPFLKKVLDPTLHNIDFADGRRESRQLEDIRKYFFKLSKVNVGGGGFANDHRDSSASDSIFSCLFGFELERAINLLFFKFTFYFSG